MTISENEFVRALDRHIDQIITHFVSERIDEIVEKHVKSQADNHVPSRDEIRKLVYDILSDTSFSPNLPPKI